MPGSPEDQSRLAAASRKARQAAYAYAALVVVAPLDPGFQPPLPVREAEKRTRRVRDAKATYRQVMRDLSTSEV